MTSTATFARIYAGTDVGNFLKSYPNAVNMSYYEDAEGLTVGLSTPGKTYSFSGNGISTSVDAGINATGTTFSVDVSRDHLAGEAIVTQAVPYTPFSPVVQYNVDTGQTAVGLMVGTQNASIQVTAGVASGISGINISAWYSVDKNNHIDGYGLAYKPVLGGITKTQQHVISNDVDPNTGMKIGSTYDDMVPVDNMTLADAQISPTTHTKTPAASQYLHDQNDPIIGQNGNNDGDKIAINTNSDGNGVVLGDITVTASREPTKTQNSF